MPDMLVKLYTLPPLAPLLDRQAAAGITIRRVIAPEKHVVVGWVRDTFKDAWASECEIAFCQGPPSCFVAVADGKPVGFACYDATCKGFFGPTGVDPQFRKRGIGEALLLGTLHAMRSSGYGYAIIGAAGPTEWYTRTVGAIPIADSWPGVYGGMLRG
jgi:GNAT superfamily N-acetyltransferase